MIAGDAPVIENGELCIATPEFALDKTIALGICHKVAEV